MSGHCLAGPTWVSDQIVSRIKRQGRGLVIALQGLSVYVYMRVCVCALSVHLIQRVHDSSCFTSLFSYNFPEVFLCVFLRLNGAVPRSAKDNWGAMREKAKTGVWWPTRGSDTHAPRRVHSRQRRCLPGRSWKRFVFRQASSETLPDSVWSLGLCCWGQSS